MIARSRCVDGLHAGANFSPEPGYVKRRVRAIVARSSYMMLFVPPAALFAWVLALASGVDNEPRRLRPRSSPNRAFAGRWASRRPRGSLGVTAWRDVFPGLRLEGGAGLGFSGLQLSGMGEAGRGRAESVRPLGSASRLASLSGEGLFRDRHGGSSLVMPWLNLDLVGYEHVIQSPMAAPWVFICGGLTTPLRRRALGRHRRRRQRRAVQVVGAADSGRAQFLTTSLVR